MNFRSFIEAVQHQPVKPTINWNPQKPRPINIDDVINSLSNNQLFRFSLNMLYDLYENNKIKKNKNIMETCISLLENYLNNQPVENINDLLGINVEDINAIRGSVATRTALFTARALYFINNKPMARHNLISSIHSAIHAQVDVENLSDDEFIQKQNDYTDKYIRILQGMSSSSNIKPKTQLTKNIKETLAVMLDELMEVDEDVLIHHNGELYLNIPDFLFAPEHNLIHGKDINDVVDKILKSDNKNIIINYLNNLYK